MSVATTTPTLGTMNNINPDQVYLGLVTMADEFRTQNPPDIRNCLQCLYAVLNGRVPYSLLEAKTHLQIGALLFDYTSSFQHAKSHLKKAWILTMELPNGQDIKFESISILARVYDKLNQRKTSKEILVKGSENARDQSPYWYLRMTFQLAQLYTNDEEYSDAARVLNIGAEYSTMVNAGYTRILFLLSRGMILMIAKRINEVHPVLTLASQLVESWTGSVNLKEGMKVFFLVLQVCHHLNCGQVKSVRQSLKLLQQSIQNIQHFDNEYTSLNSNDMFIWMPKEHMGVLVYLVTVLHSMQSGYMDKSNKYVDKAVSQIDKLRAVGNHSILNTFNIILLEHISMCHLVMGMRSTAIKEIVQALNICYRDPKLKQRHKPLIHTLLGMYAMSMNIMDSAENQLTMSMNISSAGYNNELCIFTSLNLAIVYLKNNKQSELNDLLQKLNPETLHFTSASLKAAAFYVLGLNSYYHLRYNDAKRYLRETLKMANSEDLNRLTSCSLVLLGHIFFSLGNGRESLNMVTPAQQLASKIPDIQVQLWAAALLKNLYNPDDPRQRETMTLHNQFDQQLQQDQFQALQMPEHNYIHWYEN